jgi:hypothetical protein
VVKAMLLVAYLRKGGGRHRRLHGSEKATLGPMIRRSDNAAASAIHGNVGNRGLRRLARRAGMKRFIPSPSWGGSQITARDQARFFFRLRGLIPERHRSYALGRSPHRPRQRWESHAGRRVARPSGGWYPAVAAGACIRLRCCGDRRLSIAVLTEAVPAGPWRLHDHRRHPPDAARLQRCSRAGRGGGGKKKPRQPRGCNAARALLA